MEEEVKNFIARYSEVTHKPIEAKGRIRNLWKRLSVRERELAMERMEDYYFTLPNINFCKTAVRYLEDKVFDNLIN